MTCDKCGEKPKKACGAFPKAVIEIDNPEKIILLRKVMVPASMGGREEFPPTIGKYHNVLLEYEADGSLFLYSSDGIPTQLSTDVTDLQRQLNALGMRIDNEHIERVSAIDAEADARRDADNTLSSRITALDDSLATVAKTGSYNDLSNKPTIGNGTLTVKRNGTSLGTFKANATTNTDVNVVVPTKTSDLTNDGEDGTSKYVEVGDLSTVATSGSYNDLANKPTIGDATITIQKNGASVGNFKTNATANKSINVTVPTKTSDLTNDGEDGTSTYVEAGDLSTVATSGSYNDLTNKPTVDTTLSTSSNNAVRNSTISNALNRDVMTDISVNSNASTTTVQIDGAKRNLYSGATSTKNLALPVASSTEAGVMNSATFDAVTSNTNNINAIMNGAVAISNLPASPTQAQLTTAWENETGLTSLINRASVYDVTNNKVWTYYTNDQTWHAASNTSQVTVNTFTNSSEGTIKGSTNVGQVFAENDGTGSVNGWDSLSNSVSANTSNISSLQTAVAGKQDTLTAGSNINISSNTISATDTKYTAGNGLNLNGTTFSVNTSVIATKSEIPTKTSDLTNDGASGTSTFIEADDLATVATTGSYNDLTNKPTIPTVNNATLTIQKNGTNVQTFTANSSTNKTANITVPTAVSELTNDSGYATTTQLNDGLATKQNTLTAGDNIQINGNTISATNTTYTAGNAIDITNGEISADIYPADFFTANSTIENCGGDEDIDGTILAPLKSIEIKGDTFQQAYSGAQLLTKKGFATPYTDSAYWGLVEGTTNTDIGDGWGSWAYSGENTFMNYFVKMSGIDGGTYEPNTIYTIKVEWANAVNLTGISVNQASNGSSPFATEVGIPFNGELSGSRTFAVTSKGSFPSGMYGLRAFSSRVDRSLPSSIDLRFTIVKGDYSSAGVEWQPYVGGIASPNPDYPQSVQVVTGEQTVDIAGKNLLRYTMSFPYTHHGITATLEDDNSITLNGTMTTSSSHITIASPLNLSRYSNEPVTVSIRTSGVGAITNAGIKNGTSTDLIILSGFSGNTSKSLTGTVNFNQYDNILFDLWFNASLVGTTFNNFNIKPQIESGSVASDYEPYRSQEYTVSLGNVELCKIGDYQDHIYKSGDDWYVHKEIEKINLYDYINSYWYVSSSNTGSVVKSTYSSLGITNIVKQASGVLPPSLSNYFTLELSSKLYSGEEKVGYAVGADGLYFGNNDWTVAQFKDFITNNAVYVYYVLETPTDTKITDATLVSQLNALANAQTHNDRTTIAVAATSPNLPASLCVEAYRDSEAGLIELISTKQGPLTAGDNITIENGVISATNTQYTAGTGLALNGTTLSVDTSVIAQKSDIPTVNNATLTIQKNGTNVQTFTANSSSNKTANITVPTKVSELTNDSSFATTTQLNTGLAAKQNTLSAGSNITISGNTISAIDTKYTAGTGISISNGVISCTFANGNPINY